MIDCITSKATETAKDYAVNKINKQKLEPNLVVFITAEEQIIKDRLQSRDGNLDNFDVTFFNFEKSIFETMAGLKPDRFKIVFNNNKISDTIEEICSLVDENCYYNEKEK